MAQDAMTTEAIGDEVAVTRAAGTIGFGAVVGVAVILGVHPFGTTALYDDGAAFLDHVSGFWIATHLVAAVLLFAFPVELARWAADLRTPIGRVLGHWSARVRRWPTSFGLISSHM